MTTRPPLSPEVRALLDRESVIPPLPGAQRARAMARARAALALPAAPAPLPSREASRVRWAAAAATVLVASAAAAAAAYGIRAHLVHAPVVSSTAPAVETVLRPAVSPRPTAAVAEPPPHPSAAPAIAARELTPAEAARAELRLLRQARAAVARRDFAGALSPIAEHARRFRNGRLVEEREALRVRALAGLGRTEEARAAASAFRARFPRSVLLPAVSQMPSSEP